jgi:hypothetical protein
VGTPPLLWGLSSTGGAKRFFCCWPGVFAKEEFVAAAANGVDSRGAELSRFGFGV